MHQSASLLSPVALVCLLCLYLAPTILAQTQPEAAPTSQTQPEAAPLPLPASSTGVVEDPSRGYLAGEAIEDPENALSTSRIIAIAQENPEIILELKSFLAGSMQARGITTQADAITDEQLFSQIAASSELRASITHFLQARGYIPEEEIESAPNAKAVSDDTRSAAQPANGRMAIAPERRPRNLDYANPAEKREDQRAQPDLQDRQSPSRTGTAEPRQAPQRPANITDEPKVFHRAAPYNLLSLRDLYTQIPDSPEQLKRFGSEVFVSHETASGFGHLDSTGNSMPLDVPLGPDYVLGPGDELNISLWGGVSESFTRTINREGAITLPEAGQIQVAGLTLGNARSVAGDRRNVAGVEKYSQRGAGGGIACYCRLGCRTVGAA